MPVTKPCILWKDLGLLVRIVPIKDLLSDIKQVGPLARFLSFSMVQPLGKNAFLRKTIFSTIF